MKKQYLITLITVIVIGAGAFFGGMMFQKSQDSIKGLTGTALTKKLESLGSTAGTRTFDGNINGANFPGGFPGGDTNASGRRAGGGFVNGQIISMDNQSITIKQQDNSTKTVYYSSTTKIDKTVTGASSDLTVGTDVTTSGTSNTDGSVTATTIQIRPASTTTTPPTP